MDYEYLDQLEYFRSRHGRKEAISFIPYRWFHARLEKIDGNTIYSPFAMKWEWQKLWNANIHESTWQM